MLYKNVKMEERGDKDPKFDPHNKTDRKILTFIIVSVSILLLLIGGCIAIYYIFFYGGAQIVDSTSSLIQ